MMAAPDERELRAKYFDWCSARLADRFLALSPDEIFEVAERAGHGRDLEKDAVVASGASHASNGSFEGDLPLQLGAKSWPEPESFRVLVARVAEVLAETLPAFEEWAAAYRQSPERFDVELLGFWKENV
jgi:hypothetical protein